MAIRVYVLFAVVALCGVFSTGRAQTQLFGNLLMNITGIVPCSIGGSVNVGTTTPVFPNAGVQLVCNGNMVSNTTTDSNGAFSIVIGLTTSLMELLTSGCKIVVTTPLATCNAALPSTRLAAAVVNGGLGGLLNGLLGNVLNLGTGAFKLIP